MTLGFGNQYSIQLSYGRVKETLRARILPQIVLRAMRRKRTTDLYFPDLMRLWGRTNFYTDPILMWPDVWNINYSCRPMSN